MRRVCELQVRVFAGEVARALPEGALTEKHLETALVRPPQSATPPHKHARVPLGAALRLAHDTTTLGPAAAAAVPLRPTWRNLTLCSRSRTSAPT